MKCRTNIAVLAAMVLCGCQTPSAVYELAEKSSSNAGAFQGQLAALSSQSANLAQHRVDNIVAMQAEVSRLDAYIRRELYMQEQSRSSKEWQEVSALLQRLTSLRDELMDIEESAALATEQRRKDLLGTRKELDMHKAALRDVAASLDALARKESTEERAKFLASFGKEVRDDMKKAEEDGDQNAARAKALVDRIKASAKADFPQ